MNHAMINKIVQASGVTPDELVLVQFWGEDKDISLMHAFANAVAALGASPVEMQQSRTVNAERFAVAGAQAFSQPYFDRLSHFDAVLDIFNEPLAISDAVQHRAYMASLFKTLSGVKRFTQIRLPSYENAVDSGLPPEEYASRMLAAYDIDYAQLQRDGKQKIKELSSSDHFTLVTDGAHRLVFNLTGREWYLDAGDGDLPCGEVYIAPLETDTQGSVYFKRLYAEEWGIFDDAVLIIKDGMVTAAEPESLHRCFTKLPEQDKTVCELGFGINPKVQTISGYTVLDEKASGTFHIAIGGNTPFGGNNPSRMHMDFVGMVSTNGVGEFIQYLEQEKDFCLIKAEALINDQRRDESDMVKIRANIFDIFATVSRTAVKRHPQDAMAFISERITHIPRAWEQSLSAAEAHENHTTAAQERIKLKTVAEIAERFATLRGDAK